MHTLKLYGSKKISIPTPGREGVSKANIFNGKNETKLEFLGRGMEQFAIYTG